jgi:hypothetical protein
VVFSGLRGAGAPGEEDEMRKTTAALAIAIASTAIPARGADRAAAPPADAVAAARAMMPKEEFDKSIASGVRAMVQEIQSQAQAKGVQLKGDMESGAREILQKVLSYEEIVKQQAGFLASRFDRTELKKLRDFFDSPTGRKFQASTSAMAEEIQGWMMQRYQSAGPELEAYAKKVLGDAAPAPGSEKESAKQSAPEPAQKSPAEKK